MEKQTEEYLAEKERRKVSICMIIHLIYSEMRRKCLSRIVHIQKRGKPDLLKFHFGRMGDRRC